ncbi:hypothetical protein PsYK624_046020 [Phanerochaete sordida]|uniref:Uncharacterized protein n=1 Tax=Phanerochaete sordida TaxID=48140 RepID=A0A9P3G6S9_9APHY|nr:hypothetical protein PsYK624_046020 [Phanerochaete sordida]
MRRLTYPPLSRSDRRNHALAQDQTPVGRGTATQTDLSHTVLAAPSCFQAGLGGSAVAWQDFAAAAAE